MRSLIIFILLNIQGNLMFAQNDPEVKDTFKVIVPSQSVADLGLITPPPGFQESAAFNGYISYQTSSAIIMTMIENAVYLKISEGMTEDFYAQNGLTFIAEKDIETDSGVNGKYFKLSFDLKGEQFIRYMVYLGDLERTLWLNITYPLQMETLVEPEIIKSIKSAKLTVANVKED